VIYRPLILSKLTGEATLVKSLSAVEVLANETLVKLSSLTIVFPGVPNRKSVSVWLGAVQWWYDPHRLISLKPRSPPWTDSSCTVPPYLTEYMEIGMGIGTTEWQPRTELDTWLLVETSRRALHFHVTYIKYVIKYD
jgi:hypothetical protein